MISEYGDEDLRQLLGQLGAYGVDGELMNLIFSADGPKPRIVLPDAISNTIRIVENEQYCLVYDRPLEDHGLSWADLAAWWERRHPEQPAGTALLRKSLHERLRRSVGNNGAEQLVLDTYVKLGFDLPALLPQVYLHYDPYTVAELGGASDLLRQADALSRWIVQVRGADLPHLHAFAQGLERDRDAVNAALTLPYSDGPTEGVNTRTKRIARQMHGQAGFALLRHRILG